MFHFLYLHACQGSNDFPGSNDFAQPPIRSVFNSCHVPAVKIRIDSTSLLTLNIDRFLYIYIQLQGRIGINLCVTICEYFDEQFSATKSQPLSSLWQEVGSNLVVDDQDGMGDNPGTPVTKHEQNGLQENTYLGGVCV